MLDFGILSGYDHFKYISAGFYAGDFADLDRRHGLCRQKCFYPDFTHYFSTDRATFSKFLINFIKVLFSINYAVF
jgi:hypothetical protein